MSVRNILIAWLILITTLGHLSAQSKDSIINLTGIVYDENYFPVQASHVINLNTHQGGVTDSLGIFHLPVRESDTLLIRNIAFNDTLVPVSQLSVRKYVVVRRRYYDLQEARIFKWGSTYEDFRKAIIEMPEQQTLGESMGLPRQDPDYIPWDMNEELLQSAGFLLSSPVSYFYHRFNKHAQSARKVYWLQENQEKHKAFDKVVGGENISSITGLKGIELYDFQAFLDVRLVCGINCTELQLYTEIHALWEVYQQIHKVKVER